MRIETIGIFGGSGFIGSSLANDLVENGFRLRIFTRSRDRARHLWLLPNTNVIEIDVFDESAVAGELNGCDAVVNLTGILNERRDDGAGFRRVHTELTRTIIKASFSAGTRRYLHMSALYAEPFAPSYYLRTKAEGENAAMAAHDDGMATTIFRPSVIFGPGDAFLNRFAVLLKLSPFVFPVPCAATVLQPVFVGDVCAAMIKTLTDRSTFGHRYDLGGPEKLSLADIVRRVAQITGRRRLLVPLGPRLSKLQAQIFEFFPGKPFSSGASNTAQH
jgi:NADH dehydrogenase